jgi:formylglycine-generating enzyme required for sulfatase activity
MRALIMMAVCVAVTASADTKCPDRMVPVPAGAFVMGSSGDDGPQHRVTLSAFCLDRTEVTVKSYAACVIAKTCIAPHVEVSTLCNRDDRPDHPVVCVDWSQAAAYCTWRGARLPTEAEWEYAARGSDGRSYPWGNDAPTAKRVNACGSECVAFGKRVLGRDWVAMYDGDDGWDTTAPVGSFPAGASPFGVLDMAGNVWEWTADWRADYTAAPATNPHGPATGTARVNRGGGWHGHLAGDIRATARSSDDPALRSNSVGFRCAR